MKIISRLISANVKFTQSTAGNWIGWRHLFCAKYLYILQFSSSYHRRSHGNSRLCGHDYAPNGNSQDTFSTFALVAISSATHVTSATLISRVQNSKITQLRTQSSTVSPTWVKTQIQTMGLAHIFKTKLKSVQFFQRIPCNIQTILNTIRYNKVNCNK